MQVSKPRHVEGLLTLHIPPKPNVLRPPSQEVKGGIDITHTPSKPICSSLQVKRWGVLTLHPQTQCAQVSKSRGVVGGLLTLHIPLKPNVLKSPSQEVEGGIDITHTPKANMLKSPSQEVGVLTLHSQSQCAQVSKSRGGGIGITHTPQKPMCSSLQVKRCGGY